MYREQTTELFREILAGVFDYDFKLFYGSSPGVGTKKILPADITFEEYISSYVSGIGFTAIIAPGYDIEDKDMVVKKLKDAFATHNMIVPSTDLRFCDDPEAYELLTKETFHGFLFSFKGTSLDTAGLAQIRKILFGGN